MLYEEYARKIRRYAQIRDSILRFKIPIICALAAILAAVSGFLITKGTVTEQISGDDEYVYGDNLSFGAKALFSDVTYEYFDGAEWSTDEPFMPGEYQVRAVTERSFGRNGYSDSFSFVISQRSATLSVSDKSVQWKDAPSTRATGLVKGDTLESATARLENESVGDTTADVDCDSAVIRTKSGYDVTAAYILTTQTTDITVIPRRITVTVNSVSREYDGTPVTADGYKVTTGSLWGDHALNVSLSLEELVDVGTAQIKATGYTIYEGGEDVTANYTVTVNSGRATVEPRKIIISSSGATKKYDGYALELPSYSLSNTVPECDELTVSVYDTPIVKPASRRHITGYTLRGKDGKDVSKNYVITVDSGMLIVTKRTLTVTTGSASKTYDGQPLNTGGHYTLGGDGLADKNDFRFRAYASVTDAKTIDNIIDYALANPECYDVTDNFGKLTVTKRKITVSTPSTEPKEYDGISVSTGRAYTIGGDGLVSESDFTLKDYVTVKNAGNHENRITYSVTNNYEVTETNFGRIVITKRKITLKTATKTAYYDGSYLEDNQPIVLKGSFVEGHYVGVQSWESLRDVQRDENGNVVGVQNKIFTWAIVSDYEGNVTSNYEVDWEYGTLTVLPLKLEILVDNIMKEYDGTGVDTLSARGVWSKLDNQGFYSYNCLYSVMRDGKYIDIIGRLSVRLNAVYNGNVTENRPFEIRYSITNGEDITGNYDVTVRYVGGDSGYITVTPYVINVNIYDKTVIYNGQRVDVGRSDYSTDKDVIAGHKLTVSIVGDFINANGDGEKYTVAFDVGAYTGNYKFNVKGTSGIYSTLKINKRPFRYYTWNYDWEYDGREHSQPIIAIEVSGADIGLASTHMWDAVSSTVPFITNVLYDGDGNVIGIKNKFDIWIYDRNGEDVTANYDLRCTKYGELIVYPRAVEIVSYSGEKIYDGTPLTARGVNSYRVLDAHSVYVLTYETMTDVLRDSIDKSIILSKYNVITFQIGYWTEGADGDNVWVDLTSNYCFGDKGYGGYLDYGTLTVYPRPFTITTSSGSWTYDRAPHSNSEYEVSELGELDGILATHRLNADAFTLNTKRTAVGSSRNILSYNSGYGKYIGLVLDANGKDVSENYELELIYGRLTVKPIEITVTPKFVGVEYDNKTHFATGYRQTGKLLSGDAGIVYVDYEGSGLTVGEYQSTVRVAVIRDEFGFGVWYGGAMTYHVFKDDQRPMYVEIGIDGEYLKITKDGTVTTVFIDGYVDYNDAYQYVDAQSGETYSMCSYRIIAKSGQISIRQRKITITCDSKTETYREGKVLTSNGCRITDGTAAEGHTIIGVASGRAEKQGIKAENTVSINDIIIMDAERNDITTEVIDNYDFEIVSGWLLMI